MTPHSHTITPSALSSGSLEIICGSMFSGKSEELIRRMRRAEIARQSIALFKHHFDTRTHVEYVTTHNGEKMGACAVKSAYDITLLTDPCTQVVGIDEIQFFDTTIISVVATLVRQGVRVIAAGLNLDFRAVPFGSMPTLLALADSVTKLAAVCAICGKDAQYTQRLINGSPAQYDDPIILVGAQDNYQARCRSCYVINKTPDWNKLPLHGKTEQSIHLH